MDSRVKPVAFRVGAFRQRIALIFGSQLVSIVLVVVLGLTGTIPAIAVIGQAVVATILVVYYRANSDSLSKVLNYTTFAIVLATIADTCALYILRVREPARRRPYRAAGYPVVPLLYIVANVAIAISLATSNWRDCLLSLGVLLSGAPIYWVFRKLHPR